ncbi:MAG TPA: tRNA pseudouridine(38-40) synthase TruA [Mycobacteriales bacterium]|jgi:tRNA pseudouridine38-40 synthase|nr:tRNA pseudouridine(38-40) synthase TruA [Mycobacteriales bacterium]
MTSDGQVGVRLRLDLAYDGTDFSGWAAQPGRRTVQSVLEDALTLVTRADDPLRLTVAGRTDAGVHATGQVAHVDVPLDTELDGLHRRLQGRLPDDIAIHDLSVAPPGFDARFAALGRRYHYRVTDGVPDPLRRRDTLTWRRPLDMAAMAAAAAGLIGEHDFVAYCRPRDGATTVRTLRRLDVSRDVTDVIIVEAEADAFCHHQVRSMVGALLSVGEAGRSPGWPAEVLRGTVRDSSVQVAAAHGLTLVGVDYPEADGLLARVAEARRRRRSSSSRFHE